MRSSRPHASRVLNRARACSSTVDGRGPAVVDVAAELARAAGVVTPALRDATDRLPEPMRPLAGFQFGWLDISGRPVKASSGKLLRPALALLSARAAGADEAAGLPAAVAVEFVHNFSLVHDDIMDHDEKRRHRATVWKAFGVPAAILLGDSLVTAAMEELLRSDAPGAARGARRLCRATQGLVQGQADDMDFEQRANVSLEDCLVMHRGKTGELLACSSALGAELQGADPALVTALSSFGMHLGQAFQLVDDVLGLWGRPEVTGKPVRSDLRSGKKTAPVLAALASPCPAADRLRDLLAAGDCGDPGTAAMAATLIEDAGGRAWAVARARTFIRDGIGSLSTVDIGAGVRSELEALARYVLLRDL